MNFEYPKNIRFKCDTCAACCGDTKARTRLILLLEAEVDRIAEKTLRNRGEFAERVVGSEPYAYLMKKTENGKCIFLVDSLCSIYQIRPLICRFYPFELKNVNGGKYAFICTDECPNVGKGPRLGRTFFERLFKEFLESMKANAKE